MKIDNKLVVAVVLTAVLFAVAAMNTQATQSYSAKTAAGWNDTQILSTDGTTESLMFNPVIIHTSNRNFEITVSAITSIVTDTRLKGEFGETDSVLIRVTPIVYNLRTGEQATVHPDAVTFASRIQKIEGKLYEEQLVCELDPISGVPISCVYDTDPQWLNLTLATTNANAFTFLSENVGAGDYEVTIEAEIIASSWVGEDETEAQELPNKIEGVIGPRTLVINEMHLAQAYAGTDMHQ